MHALTSLARQLAASSTPCALGCPGTHARTHVKYERVFSEQVAPAVQTRNPWEEAPKEEEATRAPATAADSGRGDGSVANYEQTREAPDLSFSQAAAPLQGATWLPRERAGAALLFWALLHGRE